MKNFHDKNCASKEIGKVFYGQEASRGESATTVCGVNYQLLAVMLLKYPNEQLLVPVDHSTSYRQWRQKKVDPIDWPLPPKCTRQYIWVRCHRVDSVIESSLREIIGSKNFALINLNLNFCETTIYDKVFLENLVAIFNSMWNY